MHIHEFGKKENPVILLLPGTMCYWKGNFGNVIDTLAEDFLVGVVAYTGFDESDSEDYQSVDDVELTSGNTTTVTSALPTDAHSAAPSLPTLLPVIISIWIMGSWEVPTWNKPEI